jgi:hypothetical protein
MAQKLKTKSTLRNWLLLMYFGVLLNHLECVLITSDDN